MAPRILLGCSGSVACIKMPNIISEIDSLDLLLSVTFAPTLNATYFLPKSSNGQVHVTSSNPSFRVISPEENICDGTRLEVESITAVLLAPLGANMMARLTIPFDERTGTMSNLEIIVDALTNAGKLAGKSENIPFLIAPAMNPVMWNSAHTRSGIDRLKAIYGHNFHVLPTVLKASMCGEIGYGNMETPENIARYLQEALSGTIQLIPEDPIDVPIALFDNVEQCHGSFSRTGVELKEPNLNFEDTGGSTLPYAECLRRVVATLKPDDPLNILIATEECGRNDERSPTRISVKSLTEDLMKTADLSVGKNRSEAFPIAVKFVLAKEANLTLPTVAHGTPVAFEDHVTFTDADEWQMWKKRGDPVLHIVLRQWATVFVLVHPSPQLLQKIAVGMCDDLMTSVARAWDYRKGFFVISPATPCLTNENLEFPGMKWIRLRKDLAQ